ncbi:MAG: ATP synthase subunit C family protein [Alphaproteobacteria bacterium]
MEGNIVEGLRFVGAGLAAIGMIGSGIGVGTVWASYISSLSRNPASKDDIGATIWIGFATTEAIALFALIIGMIALFV